MEQADSRIPSPPSSFPIKDLDSLASKSYTKSFDYPYIKASVPLSGEELPSRRRLLVCHDMAGGYGDDKWVQGGSNPNAYSLWHWNLMDVFVYFSHDLVTLPPPCWINAAHTHGVKVLGTFIMEWDKGREICQSLLSSQESACMYAELLAELAASLGFEGWLINMEVVIDSFNIPILLEFLNHLTRSMHASVPGSLIIWYDSVTTSGQLIWQDKLNEENKPFFDQCDGIFVNYTWKNDYPEISAALAGDRKFDVYMGIDIFGRNTYGGGKWDTNVALELLRKVDISAAIFAPGWVYETNQGPDFQTAQNRWWGLVDKSWGVLRSYPKSLPFYSNFDQGHGYHFSVEGLEVSKQPWNNISCQTIQPVLDSFTESSEQPIKIHLKFDTESYSGGSNIAITGTLGKNAIFKTRLFLVEISLGDLPIRISYSVRSDPTSILGLSISLVSKNGKDKNDLILIIEGGLSGIPADFHAQFSQVIEPSSLPKPSGWNLLETLINMPYHVITGIHAVCFRKPESMHVPSFHAELGHLSMVDFDFDFPKTDSYLTLSCHNVSCIFDPNSTLAVNVEICWEESEEVGVNFPAMWYNIYARWLGIEEDDVRNGGERYLGLTRLGRFYVSDLNVPVGVAAIRFTVQACRYDGSCQNLDLSPWLDLPVETQRSAFDHSQGAMSNTEVKGKMES